MAHLAFHSPLAWGGGKHLSTLVDNVGAMRSFSAACRLSAVRDLRFCCLATRRVAVNLRIAPTLSSRKPCQPSQGYLQPLPGSRRKSWCNRPIVGVGHELALYPQVPLVGLKLGGDDRRPPALARLHDLEEVATELRQQNLLSDCP